MSQQPKPTEGKNLQLKEELEQTPTDMEQERDKFTLFWNSSSPFSQHYITKFNINGTTYTSAEQYMMEQKAQLFGYSKTADLIMSSNCLNERKRLGRTVRGFNQSIWDRYSAAVGCQANYHKIIQTPGLLNILQTTLGTTLVEASPHDYTWGIGLGESDPRSQQREAWLGENKLGQILTELRDDVFFEFKSLATIAFSLKPIKVFMPPLDLDFKQGIRNCESL